MLWYVWSRPQERIASLWLEQSCGLQTPCPPGGSSIPAANLLGAVLYQQQTHRGLVFIGSWPTPASAAPLPVQYLMLRGTYKTLIPTQKCFLVFLYHLPKIVMTSPALPVLGSQQHHQSMCNHLDIFVLLAKTWLNCSPQHGFNLY